jgi:hypothetical protein
MAGPCRVETCDRPIRVDGWCDLHFEAWLRNSDRKVVVPATMGLDEAQQRLGRDSHRSVQEWALKLAYEEGI